MLTVNQFVMVAADVDNDLFSGGETVDRTDGDGIANLTYRVTSLYTGLDSVLGVSAGLKHFGKRRLGRSGLDDPTDVADNVWDIDCSRLLAGADHVHSAYCEAPPTQRLMKQLLKGVDLDWRSDSASLSVDSPRWVSLRMACFLVSGSSRAVRRPSASLRLAYGCWPRSDWDVMCGA